MRLRGRRVRQAALAGRARIEGEELICETYEERMTGMRGAKIKEHVCPACMERATQS
jgi:hypothetical protein